MNRHSLVLLAVLLAIGIGLGAAVQYQRHNAPPLGALQDAAAPEPAPAAGGGLVIQGLSLPAGGSAAPASGAPSGAPAAATDGSCP